MKNPHSMAARLRDPFAAMAGRLTPAGPVQPVTDADSDDVVAAKLYRSLHAQNPFRAAEYMRTHGAAICRGLEAMAEDPQPPEAA
jgi:hypothetical protein